MSIMQFITEEEGVEAVEYGVLVSLIFLAIVGAVTVFAGNATAMWSNIATHI